MRHEALPGTDTALTGVDSRAGAEENVMQTQVIPTYVHAMGDYLTSTTAPYAARRLGVTPTTRRIVDGMAAMVGVQSLMTNYEGGAIRVLPMQAHLASDMAVGAGLLSAAAFMRDCPTRDRQLLAGLGAFSIVYALMTRPTSSHEWRQQAPSRSVGVDVTSTETATSVPGHGDVLDDDRFTMPSPAHTGLPG